MTFETIKELVITNGFMIEKLTDNMRSLYITCSPSYFCKIENSNVFAIVEFKNIENKIDYIELFQDLIISKDRLIFSGRGSIFIKDISIPKINKILKNIKNKIDNGILNLKKNIIEQRKQDLEKDFK
jgi:hypothetical protein